MGIFRNRRARGLVGLAAAGAMTLSLAACGGNAAPSASTAASVSAEGTDDGASLTLWTRAPLEKQAKLPLAVANLRVQVQGVVDYGATEAGVVILALPCCILFLLLQRHYVRGFMSGALKG